MWFNYVHNSSLFQYFLLIYDCPYFLIFCMLVFELFANDNNIEWWTTHSSSKGSIGAMCPRKWSIHYVSLSVMFNPLHSSMNQKAPMEFLFKVATVKTQMVHLSHYQVTLVWRHWSGSQPASQPASQQMLILSN